MNSINEKLKEGFIMESIAFNISERNEKGKKVRRNGEIPCIVYGEDILKSTSAKMSKRDVNELLTYPKSSMFSLNLNGKVENCVVKELQKDNFGKVIHIDFQNVRKDEKIKLKIPVTFLGEGMLESKQLLLETFLNEIELHGEVDKLPAEIEFDASNLEYGNKVCAKDLTLPEGIELGVDEDLVIAKVEGNVTVTEDEEEEK